MKLSKEEVRHIAALARIGLTKEEEKAYAAQISAILEYVEILSEVDTEGVPITAQVTGLANVTREDRPQDSSPEVRKGIMDSFPQKDGRSLKVKTVLTKEE